MRVIPTHYPHTYNPDGTRRQPACSGHLQIICDAAMVYVRCDCCDERYQFDFVMGGTSLARSRGDEDRD